MPTIVELLSLANPVFKAYCGASALLSIKSYVTNFWIASLKVRNNTLSIPEDKALFKDAALPKTGFGCDHPDVKRGYHVLQNDFENFAQFYTLGMLYVITGGSSTVPFYAFVASRYLHSFLMGWGLNPLGFGRGVVFFVSLASSGTMLYYVASKSLP